MQDMIVDVLVVTRLVDGKIGIHIQGTDEEDHALHMVGGWMIILTHIGGAGSVPCQNLDKSNQIYLHY